MGDSGDEQTAIVRNIYDNAQIILEDSVSSGTDNYEFEYRTCQKEHCPGTLYFPSHFFIKSIQKSLIEYNFDTLDISDEVL
jgi:hypothetical protein